MAYGEQFTTRSSVAYTIHVWPTQELIAQSWTWSERWRTTYREIAWAISLAAATQVLEGGTFAHREIEIETEIGRVRFTISQVGTTVHIVVSEFSGPEAPDPNGGIEAQPHAIDGLVIGLRGGSNRSFHVVVFYGEESSIPFTNRINSNISNEVVYAVDRAQFDLQNIIVDLTQFIMDDPKTNANAWAERLLRNLQAYLRAVPKTRFDDPLDSVAVDPAVEAEALREGAGISSSRLPTSGFFAGSPQEIYFGVAIMESTSRTNPASGQDQRQSSFKRRLH
jgi:hypothetical protein